MTLITTEYLDALLAATAADAGGGGFNPPLTNLLLWVDIKGNLFTDSGATTPAVAQGDPVRRWNDYREAPGGTIYPYVANYASSPLPTYYPGGVGHGGVLLDGGATMAAVGMPAYDLADMTVVRWGLPLLDISQFHAAIQCNGNYYSTSGVILVANDQDAAPPYGGDLSVVYTASGAEVTGVDLNVTPTVITEQSTGAGLLVNVNGVDGVLNPPVTPGGLVPNVLIGFDTSVGSEVSYTWEQGQLIYSPHLDDTSLATLRANLLTITRQCNPWPATWPLLAFVGDSLTYGAQFSTPAGMRANAWPWQLLNGLSQPCGHVTPAINGGTTAELLNWYVSNTLAGFRDFYNAGRTAPQICFLLIGVNDLNNSIDPATVYANIQEIGSRIRARGWTVVIMTTWDYPSSGGMGALLLTLRNLLLADFPHATTAPRVSTAGTGVTYGQYCIDTYSNPQLDPVAHPGNYSSGVHLTAGGYTYVKDDAAALLALPAINVT